VSLEEARLAFN